MQLPPAAGERVELAGVDEPKFDGIYTVQAIPPAAGLPATAVYLAAAGSSSIQTGDSSGGGRLETPIFVAPPVVPDNQFYAIAAPKDWLANQLVSTANDDPLVTWWDATVDDFFKAGNFLQVAVETGNYTGTYNVVTNAFDFRAGLVTTGTVAFSIAKPTPENVFGDKYTSQSQSLANATWVWGQGNIPGGNRGLVWDQIVAAFCRGVAMDGVFTSAPTESSQIGESNTAWTVVSEWYRNTSTYCPFSKFVHYGTLTGTTDRTGTESIYVGNYAYGFSEDETPLGPSGTAIATQVPSKMDGTVPDGETVTRTINPWLPATAPTVVSIDTATKRDDQPTTAASVDWTVTCSQPVSGVTAANFALEPAATLAGTSITEVRPGSSGSTSQTWTVTASTGTGYGLLGLDMTSTSGVKNASDEPLRLDMVNVTGITDAVDLPPTGVPFVGQQYQVDRKTAPIDFAPTAFWATAGAASPLVWPRGLTPFVDGRAVQLDVTLAVTAAGRLEAASAGGVTVSGSGGTELTFSGSVTALDAYFRQTGRMSYTPTGGSLDPRFVTLSSSGSDGLSGGTTSVILVKGAAAPSPAPAVSGVGQLGPAHVSRPLEISYAQLAAATGATPGTINAFQVKVFDGSRYSAASQVQITTVDSYQSLVWDAGSFFVSATSASRRVLDVSARSQSQTLTVSLAAAAYLIDGEENPTLVISRGQTYRFDLNVPGEPFTLQTVGGGYELAFVYNEGVSGNGETSGQLIWAVPETGPDELFYQSAATPEFGGKIIVARLPLD